MVGPVDFLRSTGVRYDSENAAYERAQKQFGVERSSLNDAQRRGFESDDGRGIPRVVEEGRRTALDQPQPERSGGSGSAAAFAVKRASAPRVLTDTEVERQWSGLKSTLGPIASRAEDDTAPAGQASGSKVFVSQLRSLQLRRRPTLHS